MLEANIEKIFKYLAERSVTLVAVTKTVAPERIEVVLQAGVTDVGESRIQEASLKFAALGPRLVGVRKHLIGHLQTNKAKKAVEYFDLIQSVDRIALAEVINMCAGLRGKIQDCLLEVKVSDEETKHGIAPAELAELYTQVLKLKNIRICGLMAMAPFFEDPELSRVFFKKARQLFDEVRRMFPHPEFTILSMGMSNDYRIAVEEGSTMVRIGTALFAEK
ncbi:MAG: YggS family pyridoxal phosphate-dependent enzyme [Elusimicrobia bacterium]|nr:YggS family pyridoxal phosphate-dependent enzyme [Elusimicrobiota bacterium]